MKKNKKRVGSKKRKRRIAEDHPTQNLESGDHRFETLPQDIAEIIFLDIFEKRGVLDWTNLNLVCKNWHKIAQIALERNSVIHRFNKALKTPFSCSGELDSQIDLWTRFGKTTFPCSEQSAILNLISLCKPASFGRGSVEVNDPDYRSALVLEPSEFATNFHPSNCNILNDVRRILAPRFHQVNCHLYRVNIYPAGGFFKVHKDTPQGEHHIGSLVVTLPSPHLGGDLIISHDFRTEKLDSSWDPSNSSNYGGRVKWIAFYGDCDHWVEPVTSGFRVTLTYHLFTSMNPDSSILPINEPIYSHLKDMIANQNGDGKKWAFFLKHEYTNKELSTACSNPTSILRGSDALLYSAAASLGISAKIRAVFLSTAFDWDWEEKCLMYSKDIPVDLVPPIFTESTGNIKFLIDFVNAKFILPERVTWCTPKALFRNLAGSTSVSTGNEPSTEGIYFQAALFLNTSESQEHKEARRRKEQKMDRKLREFYEESKKNGVYLSNDNEDWVNLLEKNGLSKESGMKWFAKLHRN